MPLGAQRRKILYGLGKSRGRLHRYTIWRWIVGIVFTIAVALIPLTGILRLDLWGGRHVIMGREVGLVEAVKGFAFPFLAVNVVIIIASRLAGRYLCGFVCPVGSLARLGEWLRWRDRKGGRAPVRLASMFAICLLLAAVTFTFWVDWRVFASGSMGARAVAGAFLASMTFGLFAFAYGLGLGFCRDWCPSGVYFALLGEKTSNGVEFAHPETCTECKACERACPMDLLPTQLDSGERRGGAGFYPDALSNHSLCIRCGDCIAVCEGTTGGSGDPTPLRMGWLDGADRGAESECGGDEVGTGV